MGMCFACTHRSERDRCAFFKFPVSPGLRKKWSRGVNRRDGKSPKAKVNVLCSCHFPGGDKSKTPKMKLKSPQSKSTESNEKPRNVCSEPLSSPWKVTNLLDTSSSFSSGLEAMASLALSSPRQTVSASSHSSQKKNRNIRKGLFQDVQAEKEDDSDISTLLHDIPNNDLVAANEKLRQEVDEYKETIKQVKRSMDETEVTLKEKEEEVQNLETSRKCLQLNLKEAAVQAKEMEANEKKLSVRLKEAENKLKEMEANEKKLTVRLKEADNKLKEMEANEKKLTVRLKEADNKLEEMFAKNKELAEKLCDLEDKKERMEGEIETFRRVSSVLKSEKEQLKSKVAELQDRYKFKSLVNENNVSHYTGLATVGTFFWLLSLIPEKLNYYFDTSVKALSREDQLFMTLYKLRRNHSHQSLADWFQVSIFTVSNVIITWFSALHTVLVDGLLAQNMPSLEKVKKSMPASFMKYPNCRMIFDCTEITVQVPEKMSLQNEVYSSYKHRTTFKGLVVSCPNGTIIFASDLYPGSTSDAVIVEKCGILAHLTAGDSIMADKGFLIKSLLPAGVGLNLPPFKETPQFTSGQVFETLEIAKSRIHIERAIQRAKLFHILDMIPHSLFQFSSKIFQVCCALTNLRYPLIQEVEAAMRELV